MSGSAPGDAERPNILVILADDLGWADLSCYGSPDIRTPNLDRLARQGMRFTQAYSGSSTCSPTRFSLYTGRYPGRTEGGLAEPITSTPVGLQPGHPTLASLLRDAGYDTAMIGKWHCGFLPDYSPTKSGWDSFFGNFGGALEYYSKLGAHGYDLYEGDATYHDLRYYTRILTERSVEHIRSRRGTAPWLLNLNFTTPHWPWIAEGDEEEAAELARRVLNGEGEKALGHLDGGSLEKYAEMVEGMDRAVGEVLDAVGDSGQQQNTLVLFTSDNGGERWSYQWPLSGNKSTLQEGGIRVPLIARWPARLNGGKLCEVPNFSQDWTATLLELGGTGPAATHPLDGHSLAGYLLRDEHPPQRDLFWRVRRERALRRGEWKYYRGTDSRDRLFNLADDVREFANRAEHQPALLAELRTAWETINAGLLPYPV